MNSESTGYAPAPAPPEVVEGQKMASVSSVGYVGSCVALSGTEYRIKPSGKDMDLFIYFSPLVASSSFRQHCRNPAASMELVLSGSVHSVDSLSGFFFPPQKKLENPTRLSVCTRTLGGGRVIERKGLE